VVVSLSLLLPVFASAWHERVHHQASGHVYRGDLPRACRAGQSHAAEHALQGGRAHAWQAGDSSAALDVQDEGGGPALPAHDPGDHDGCGLCELIARARVASAPPAVPEGPAIGFGVWRSVCRADRAVCMDGPLESRSRGPPLGS